MTAMIPFPNIGPDVFSVSLFGVNFALRWYALSYIIGILIGWRIVLRALRTPRLWKNEKPVMTYDQVEDLLFWIILGVILGGRLGYVIFYQPSVYLADPIRVLFLWEGGMAFHGGVIGVVLAAVFCARKHGLPLLPIGDMVTLGLTPGLFLGRLANFINAELWGRSTEMPWGVVFPSAAAQDCPGVNGPCARHPSQLYEAVLEGVLLGALLFWLAWQREALKKDGLLVGTFLSGYGIARFCVEFFRQPDAQFITPGNPLGLAWQIGGYGLTMGQILCLPMIIIGIVLIQRSRMQHM
ncbi:MAG: prolipoprotein diacylglyceryl transferase [Pseudomonadota bacterium]